MDMGWTGATHRGRTWSRTWGLDSCKWAFLLFSALTLVAPAQGGAPAEPFRHASNPWQRTHALFASAQQASFSPDELLRVVDGRMKGQKGASELRSAAATGLPLFVQQLAWHSRAGSNDLVPKDVKWRPRVGDASLVPKRRSLWWTTETGMESCEQNKSAKVGPEGMRPPLLQWQPMSGKYLLAICQFGLVNNQMSCIRKYFRFAATLGRTLVIPTFGFWYQESNDKYKWRWDAMLDFGFMRGCLAQCCGARAVMTVEEYLKETGAECLNLTQIYTLYESTGQVFKEEHVRGREPLRYTGVCMKSARLHKKPEEVKEDEYLEQLMGVKDPVISLDSVFAYGPTDNAMFSPVQVPPECVDLWQPHKGVRDFVAGFISTFLEPGFATLHLRRGSFYQTTKEYFPPIPDLASYLTSALAPMSISVLYVATNGSPTEVAMLAELMADFNKDRNFKLVHVPIFLLAENPKYANLPWVKSLSALEQGTGGILRSVAEKYLCSYGSMFIGTPTSTFSSEIHRIRRASKRTSCYDSDIPRVSK